MHSELGAGATVRLFFPATQKRPEGETSAKPVATPFGLHVLKLEERRTFGLYNLEGRRVPADAFDDDDEEGGSYAPAFGRPKDRPEG